jgi:hypothetical protein
MSGSAPQFPDPLGVREVVRPGATAHKAGLDLVRRVAALEQGALGRPGPGVAAGSTVISDTTQAGGVGWKQPPPLLVANASGSLAATGAGTFWLSADMTASWDGGTPRIVGANIFSMKRSDLVKHKGGTGASVRMSGTILTNGTAYTGTVTLRLYEITSSNGGSAVLNVNRTQRMASSAVTLTANMLSKDALTDTVALNSTNFPNDHGVYALTMTTSATGAANSIVAVIATVEVV